ncbi:MAG: acylphosphatase [Planctomycetes bacterium]|nr:acylphosphatase [Planctomycetota bacterium]
MKDERIRVVFHGRVQGVGFRARTCEAARTSGARGWVRNNADGTVECVAEGSKEVLELFLGDVLSSMSRYVRSHEVSRGDATGEFAGFGVHR